MRSVRGQASVDYVALIAVVALVFAAALALAWRGGPGIVNALVAQVRHALCVVGGGSCPRVRSQPCTVASRRDLRHVAVNLLLVRVDDDRYVLRERMSDGTIRLTVARSNAAGVELGAGARASATLRGRPLGAWDEARAGAQGVVTIGRVFVARDAREADAFLRAIRSGRPSPAPPREEFLEGGARAAGKGGLGGSIAGGTLEGLSGTVAGVRRDRRTGAVTLTFAWVGSARGAVTVALGGPVGAMDRATTLGLTLDRRRRPIELSLSAGGAVAAGARLAPRLRHALGNTPATVASSGGRRWELAARLDLRDPSVAATWRRLRRDPGSGEAVRALGEAIRDRAQLDVSAYRTDGSLEGAEAGVALGLRVGGELERSIERARLLAASSRPPGGLWEPRIDCVSA